MDSLLCAHTTQRGRGNVSQIKKHTLQRPIWPAGHCSSSCPEPFPPFPHSQAASRTASRAQRRPPAAVRGEATGPSVDLVLPLIGLFFLPFYVCVCVCFGHFLALDSISAKSK